MLSTIDRKKHPLFVLNASAGSGKTYQLVLEYLSILLRTPSGVKYKSIVAITFTNKASLEMKTRIIDALFKLSKYDMAHSDPKTISIVLELMKILDIDEREILIRSRSALTSILHGYENFNVSTIDKFNLRLIKSFSNDLELPNDFEISLNEKEVLEEVLDLLLSSIGEKGNIALTKLVKAYAKNNFKEGDQWNFRRKLVSFASSLSKEENQVFIKLLKESSFSKEDYELIQKEINTLHAKFISKTAVFAHRFYELNINWEDLPYKKSTYNALKKVADMKLCPVYKKDEHIVSDRVMNYCSEPGNTKALTHELKALLIDVDDTYLEIVPTLSVLLQYRSNFFNMALLKYIQETLNDHREKNKIIRISEFNSLIGGLVQQEKASYIYERFGVRYEHFLLDEFQDTSRLQWLNLLPLIEESLSYRRQNLIVGDPKQSIYRFNNGLAEQFVSLPKIYNPENDPHVAQISSVFDLLGCKKPLTNNYRSCPEVVHFNEEVFKNFSQKLPENFSKFYASVSQVPVSKKTGFVQVISSNKKRETQEMISEIKAIIDECEKDDFSLGDICILTAKNDLGVLIANELTKKGVSVFSQESLLISKNMQVRLLLSYLKWRMRPTMDAMKRQFAELFFRMQDLGDDDYYLFLKDKISKKGASFKFFDDEAFLDKYFKGRSRFFRPFENIYELAILFVAMMKWKESENPFLHQFIDLIFQFQNNRQSDLAKFIEYYEANKGKFALKMPDSQNAVQIMTIHKAKGLEFPIVIIPEMDFGLGLRADSKFFVESRDKIIYTSLSQTSINKDIVDKSNKEKNLILLDKLNMLYVAFTRAENRLYVFNRYKGKRNMGYLFHECLIESFSLIEEEGCCRYISGTEVVKEKEGMEKASDSFYTASDVSIDPSKVELILSDELSESHSSQSERLFGIYFHQFMAQVNRAEQIQDEINVFKENDLIDSSILNQIADSALLFFEKAADTDLFKDVLDIHNEQDILISKSPIMRPDKIIERIDDVVVVDFKTGSADNSHHEQIWNYKAVLEEIYHKPVKSILYYTQHNQLLEI